MTTTHCGKDHVPQVLSNDAQFYALWRRLVLRSELFLDALDFSVVRS